MTAEIAIMNKTAIALAADSAGTSGTKVYNSENKLFMLSKYFPVGIMVYDLLGFMGVPWEYIIKTYRNKLDNNSFDNLKGYSDDFLKYLEDLISVDLQKEFFEVSARDYLTEIEIFISQYLKDVKANDENLNLILQQNCDKVSKECIDASIELSKKMQINIFLEGHKIMLKTEVDHKWNQIPEQFIKDIEDDKDYQNIIRKLIEEIFGDLSIMDDFKDDLKDIAILTFYKINSTGVVIAGFGENEKFPSVISTNVGPQINGKVEIKPNIKETCEIKHFKGARIIPFAQHEMVDAFLDGVTPKYHSEAENCLKDLDNDNYNNIMKIIDETEAKLGRKKVSEDFIESLKKEIDNIQDGSHLRKFNKKMKTVKEEHKNPMLWAINILPKDELALMAESLVDITSLKRKASINELETVGGAIDVAVISKGDGFIWIKRKHYFNPDLNHHFFEQWFDRSLKKKKKKHK